MPRKNKRGKNKFCKTLSHSVSVASRIEAALAEQRAKAAAASNENASNLGGPSSTHALSSRDQQGSPKPNQGISLPAFSLPGMVFDAASGKYFKALSPADGCAEDTILRETAPSAHTAPSKSRMTGQQTPNQPRRMPQSSCRPLVDVLRWRQQGGARRQHPPPFPACHSAPTTLAPTSTPAMAISCVTSLVRYGVRRRTRMLAEQIARRRLAQWAEAGTWESRSPARLLESGTATSTSTALSSAEPKPKLFRALPTWLEAAMGHTGRQMGNAVMPGGGLGAAYVKTDTNESDHLCAVGIVLPVELESPGAPCPHLIPTYASPAQLTPLKLVQDRSYFTHVGAVGVCTSISDTCLPVPCSVWDGRGYGPIPVKHLPRQWVCTLVCISVTGGVLICINKGRVARVLKPALPESPASTTVMTQFTQVLQLGSPPRPAQLKHVPLDKIRWKLPATCTDASQAALAGWCSGSVRAYGQVFGLSHLQVARMWQAEGAPLGVFSLVLALTGQAQSSTNPSGLTHLAVLTRVDFPCKRGLSIDWAKGVGHALCSGKDMLIACHGSEVFSPPVATCACRYVTWGGKGGVLVQWDVWQPQCPILRDRLLPEVIDELSAPRQRLDRSTYVEEVDIQLMGAEGTSARAPPAGGRRGAAAWLVADEEVMTVQGFVMEEMVHQHRAQKSH